MHWSFSGNLAFGGNFYVCFHVRKLITFCSKPLLCIPENRITTGHFPTIWHLVATFLGWMCVLRCTFLRSIDLNYLCDRFFCDRSIRSRCAIEKNAIDRFDKGASTCDRSRSIAINFCNTLVGDAYDDKYMQIKSILYFE